MSSLNSYPTPLNEPSRAQVACIIGDKTKAEDPLFAEAAEIAREQLKTKFGIVSLIDSDRSMLLAHPGLDVAEIPKELALCAHTFVTREPLVILDAKSEPAWSNHPAVAGPPHVRFYAGAPIMLSTGFAIGTVCAIDTDPKTEVNAEDIRLLQRLANMVARAHEMPIAPDAAAAAALAAAQREAQEEFLSLVSHELRTPLNGLLGIAEILTPQTGRRGPPRRLGPLGPAPRRHRRSGHDLHRDALGRGRAR